jgi:hypothetical protein
MEVRQMKLDEDAMCAALKKIADGLRDLFQVVGKGLPQQQGGQGEHRPAPHAAAPGTDHPAAGEPPGRDHLPAVGGGAVKPTGERSASVPRTGKALYAWVKDIELRHEVGMLKYLNGWGKLQDYPARMVEWDDEQVAAAYAEGMRKLASVVVGPCVIRESDPLKDLKLRLRLGAYKLAMANAGGEIPTSEKETRTMALIDTIAADACNGEMVGNLRDSVNEGVLRRVLAAIEEDIAALEAKA